MLLNQGQRLISLIFHKKSKIIGLGKQREHMAAIVKLDNEEVKGEKNKLYWQNNVKGRTECMSTESTMWFKTEIETKREWV